MGVRVGSRALSPTVYQVDASHLPVTHVDRPPRPLGVFLILFALLWGGIPAAILAAAVADGSWEPGMLFLLLFVAMGGALLLAGLWVMTQRKEITIDRDRVSVDSRSLFAHSAWQEPLQRFQGVLARTQFHSGGKNHPSYTLYIVELLHEDRRKTIRLYSAQSDAGFRRIWKDYCRQLNRPALEKEGRGIVARAVEDLDKSVRDLAAEGKLDVAFDPGQAPPRGFEVEVVGDSLRVGLPRHGGSALGFVFGFLLAGVFVFVGFRIGEAPVILGVFGLLFMAVMLVGAAWVVMTRAMVDIRPGQIHLYRHTPWGQTAGNVIPSEDIEAVRIGQVMERQRRDGVVVATGESSEVVGEGLSAEQLEWLKNCMLAVITP